MTSTSLIPVSTSDTEFEGHASWGKTIPQNDINKGSNDHGTHCIAMVGSHKYGVAKVVNLIAVKVLGSNRSGTMGDIVVGVTWAAGQAAKKLAAAKAEYTVTGKMRHKGLVVNMSPGGSVSQALNNTINVGVLMKKVILLW